MNKDIKEVKNTSKPRYKMIKEQNIEVGDSVFVIAREPMPNEMRLAFGQVQVVNEILNGSCFIFESGWSANSLMGDKIIKSKEKHSI